VFPVTEGMIPGNGADDIPPQHHQVLQQQQQQQQQQQRKHVAHVSIVVFFSKLFLFLF